MTDTPHDSTASRPGVFSLVIRSKAALYAAWMPLLRGGGLFVPSNREYNLGETVLVLLTLLDETGRIPVQGKVAWINPPHAANNRPQGVGVQLPDDEACRQLRKKVEALLGGALNSARPTLTL